jgi:hypothetical protein
MGTDVPRNRVVIFDIDLDRAIRVRQSLVDSLPESLKTQLIFSAYERCVDVMKRTELRQKFITTSGFVLLHYNNRSAINPTQPRLSEDLGSFDEVVKHCDLHKVPLIFTTGQYFWENGTTGKPTGLHMGPTWLGNDKLLVSYGQFLDRFGYKLIELWKDDRWNTQTAARLIERTVQGENRKPVLSLVGCDLLVQGYLAIWNSEQNGSLPRDAGEIFISADILERARRSTWQSQLSRGDKPSEISGACWFDDCVKDIEEAFSSKADVELQEILKVALPPFDPQKWIVRCLHSSYSRGAALEWWKLSADEKSEQPGALRLLVEIIKGTDKTFLQASGWPKGFETEHADIDKQAAIFKLMSYAHEEFVRAWHDLDLLSRSDLYSFESTRNELHHDKLKNEFLFAVAYDPDDVGNETRHQIMHDAIKGDESSLRLLKRGSGLWRNLGPTLTGFFNSLSRRYGFVVSDHYKQSKDEVKEAVSTIDAIMEKVETGKFMEQDIDIFWIAADKIRGLLSDLAMSRRFGDYVIDIDSRLIEENNSA